MHNSPTDTMLFMPRELVIFGMIRNLKEVENEIIGQGLLTGSFLLAALENKEGPEFKNRVLEKYRERMKEFAVQDTLLIDK